MRALLMMLAVLVVAGAAGAVQLVYQDSSGEVSPREAETPFGQRVAGTDLGTEATNATVPLTASLTATTTEVLYLNNTNATGAWYGRLVLNDLTGLSNLALLEVGIDNGTARTDQVTVLTGTVTQAEGPYVRLDPGSTNRLYVTQEVLSLLTSNRVEVDVLSSVDDQGSAYTKTRFNVTIG